MANHLSQFGAGTRRLFCARFSSLVDQHTPRGLDVDVMLVKLRTWPELAFAADRIFFRYSTRWQRLGRIQPGQMIAFEARVVNVEVGYDGEDFLLRHENPRRRVWKLSNPSKVMLVESDVAIAGAQRPRSKGEA